MTCDALHLNVISCSCTCGNKWTHSHPWLASREAGYLGGTPTPIQMEKLQFISYQETRWNVNGCWRCVPLQLGVGWIDPLKLPAARAADAQAIEDELLS